MRNGVTGRLPPSPPADGCCLGDLDIGLAGNVLAGLAIVKGRKAKILCWEWTAVFAGLLLVCWGFTRGDFNFNWLKQGLLWLQNHF